MNNGIFEIPYAPPATIKRGRVYNRTKKSYNEFIIIGTGDNETVSSNRGIGSATELDRTDFVIDISKVYKNSLGLFTSISSFGALMLNIPDGTLLNGDKRGSAAVDLQQIRSVKTQVASGDYSFIAGYCNTASGNGSMAIGSNNTASSSNCIAIGSGNTASYSASVALGSSNTASNYNSVALGSGNTASGANSVALGSSNTASGANSIALGVYSRSLVSSKFSIGADTTTGTQTGIFSCGVQTTDATTNVVLKSDQGVAGSANQLVLENNSSVIVHGYVVGQVTATSSICFEIKALVRRGANASAISLVGTPTITKLFNDTALASCTCNVVVDTTLGAMSVRVSGIASTTIRWSCTLITSEVV